MGKKKDEKRKETGAVAATGGSLYDLRARMDDLFDELMHGGGGELAGRFGEWDPWPRLRGKEGRFEVPALDVGESKKAFNITMELPGVEEEDLEISLSHGLLTVRGEKKEESEDESEDRHVTECRYGSFQRSVRLPTGIDENAVSAKFKKGVLKIKVPKSADTQATRKTISVSSD